MWLFTKFGFYSVTKAKYTRKKGMMQIRARHDVDLLNLKNEVKCLKMKKIHCFPDADYRYRLIVWPSELSEVFDTLQDKLDYSNFKNEVHAHPNQSEKYNWYTKVWGIMFGYQREKEQEKLGTYEQRHGGQQLSAFGGYSIRDKVDLEEESGHEPIEGELNDYPELREIPYTEKEEKELYG